MLIVYVRAPGPGWHPVSHMVRLAASCFSAEVLELPEATSVTMGEKLLWMLRRRRHRGDDICLLVCPGPRDLLALHQVPAWHRRFGMIAAWVIDSFWLERLSQSSRLAVRVDRLFVTAAEDVDAWQRACRVPTSCLAWGTDALGLASPYRDRPIDLQRVGRQPVEWDDDERTAQACSGAGLTFAGRPPCEDDPTANQRALTGAFGRAKFVLAFSNRVDRASYTHPTKEYVTARWTDALANGATVAGIRPRSPTADDLLWSEATFELSGIERAPGLTELREAVRTWRPQVAEHNAAMALRRLDWRWRFKDLAKSLDVRPPALQQELVRLEAAVATPRPLR